MFRTRFHFQWIAFVSILAGGISHSVAAGKESILQSFGSHDPESSQRFDFTPVNQLLDASVLVMGPSKRTSAQSDEARVGTRMVQLIHPRTGNEANRFYFEAYSDQEKKQLLENVVAYLESLPAATPLAGVSRNEQLAYWLNLHNVKVISELANRYPVRRLAALMAEDEDIVSQKSLTVSGVELSLHDIRHTILPHLAQGRAEVLYGLYLGYIGGPNLLDKAFTGRNLDRLLRSNAREFINSNRGTDYDAIKGFRVSSLYQQFREYFADFEPDLRTHLDAYLDTDFAPYLASTGELDTVISNWNITDVYGTYRNFGGGGNTNGAALGDYENTWVGGKTAQLTGELPTLQYERIRQLMRTRAVNLGGTSVTVTDMESDEGQ